jgi:hypothetical protein
VASTISIGGALASADAASAAVAMPTIGREMQIHQAVAKWWAAHPAQLRRTSRLARLRSRRGARRAAGYGAPRSGGSGFTPITGAPCPENGVLYPSPVPSINFPNEVSYLLGLSGVPWVFGNCGVSELPAAGAPWMGPMAYYGGHVQVHPKEYVIYWGWNQAGFPGRSCSPEAFSEGTINVALPCDPDAAGKYMADFVHQMGGTSWAGVSTQYYETDSSGNSDYIQNDKNLLAGVWVDNGDGGADNPAQMASSNSGNPAGETNTLTLMAQEAERAAAHFGVNGAARWDANFVILEPPAFSDPNALQSGYCAFHDYTNSQVPGNFYYDPKYVSDQDIAYTNYPYQTAINGLGLGGGAIQTVFGALGQQISPVNECGENSVNSGPQGKLDGFSIALGHEIEETITDPGAEDTVGQGANVTEYGGWYDATDADENGDKCAWVGNSLLASPIDGSTTPIPGALSDMTGNAGGHFAVQSLWSNADDEGTGYCGGTIASPIPAAAYGGATAPSVPSNTGAPAIPGAAVVGQTLSATNGSWSQSPTTYVYQWQRCDAGGQGCIDIDGATSSTYTPTSSDLGSTLAVQVYAANANGSSLPATSAPTAAVAATGAADVGAASTKHSATKTVKRSSRVSHAKHKAKHHKKAVRHSRRRAHRRTTRKRG